MSGIGAAPNKVILTGTVIFVQPLEDNKVSLTLQLEKVKCMFGPCFAQEGENIRCFSFIKIDSFFLNQKIVATAEYIGGPRDGIYQILELEAH